MMISHPAVGPFNEPVRRCLSSNDDCRLIKNKGDSGYLVSDDLSD